MLDAAEIGKKLLEFETRFGRGGVIDTYFAPGRVNLIGDHTDYNGGHVLPIAIEQGNYLLIRRSELPPARLYSASVDMEARILPNDIKKERDWADYVRGVYLYSRKVCPDLPPFDALYFGDLPLDSGLSSSASIEIVTAIGLESLGCSLSRSEAIKLSRRAENDFVGVFCGVMDQFTVAMAEKGNAVLLNCGNMEVRQIPYNIKDAVVVVGHTGVRRSLSATEYNARRHECEEALRALSEKLGPRQHLADVSISEFEKTRYSIPQKLAKRAEHVIYENSRVEEAARCLERGDTVTLGHLMNRSHESLRDLFDVTTEELDALQELSANQQGVWGCRMTGAGFGGCVVALVKPENVERYLRRMPSMYWKATHYDAEFIVTSPGAGAHKV
ncbi:MAG TPA: galactokinase [Candidatus Anoxymicrobiaceae bacterium]